MSDSVFDDIEGRKGEILEAALDEFAEHSYEGGTMRRIADRVGVTEPAIYRHFPGKRALFETFVRLAARRILAEGRALIEASHADDTMYEDPAATLAAALSDRSAMIQRRRRLIRTVVVEVVRDPEIMEIWKTELVAPGSEVMAGAIREIDLRHGIERSERELAVAVRVFLTMIVGYIVSSFAIDRDDSVGMAAAVCRALGWPTALEAPWTA